MKRTRATNKLCETDSCVILKHGAVRSSVKMNTRFLFYTKPNTDYSCQGLVFIHLILQ